MFDPNKIDLKARILQKALVFNDEGKFLAIKRASTDFSRPNKWDLPGGWLESGEDPNKMMLEKILQESGVVAKKIKPFTMDTLFDKTRDQYVFFLCFKAKDIEGSPILTDEHSEHRWVTKDEFLRLESADFLERFVERL